MPSQKVEQHHSDYEPRVESWDPEEAYLAYLKNPIVEAVNHALSDEQAPELRRAAQEVVATSSDALTPLSEPNWFYKGQSNLDRLRSSLLRAAFGSKEDLQNRIFARFTKSGKLVTNRQAIIGEFLSSVKWDTELDQVIYEMEEAQASKAASRSLAWPWDIVGDKLTSSVLHRSPSYSEYDSVYYRDAISTLQSWVPNKRIVPLTLEKVISKDRLSYEELQQFYADNGYTPMDTTTSSGAPWYLPAWYPSSYLKVTDRELYSVVSEVYADLKNRVSSMREAMKDAAYQPTSMIFQMNRRTNDPKGEADPDLKSTRLVMGVDKWEPMLAKTFTVPITDHLKRLAFEDGVKPFAGMMGSKIVDASVHAMLLGQQRFKDDVVSGDMSSYDGSINERGELQIAEAISSWVRYPDDAKVLANLYMASHYNVNLPTPGKLFTDQYCTRASGSGFTLLGNSLYLCAFLLYGHKRGAYKLRSFMVQGDDFLVAGQGINSEVLSQVASDLGLHAHPDKQFNKFGYAEFLQTLHTSQFPGGVASAARTLCHMAAPERRASGVKKAELPYFDVVRALGQLHNCEFHPYFWQLVQFVKAYDRNRLFENMRFTRVVQLAGDAGKDLLAEYVQEGRKTLGHITGEMQLANKARQGEYPPPCESRYPLVYGTDWQTALKTEGTVPIKIV